MSDTPDNAPSDPADDPQQGTTDDTLPCDVEPAPTDGPTLTTADGQVIPEQPGSGDGGGGGGDAGGEA